MNTPATLPGGLQRDGCTPRFDEATLPESLQKEHVLTAGRWGVLQIFDGAIWFVDQASGHEKRVTAPESLVIEPEKPHRLRVDGPVALRVEFHARPAT